MSVLNDLDAALRGAVGAVARAGDYCWLAMPREAVKKWARQQIGKGEKR